MSEKPARYLNRMDSKVYVFASENEGIVAFRREGREALAYLGRAEFDKRFQLLADTPSPVDQMAVTYDHIERLQHAIEGECDGLMIDGGQALAIISYVLSPPAPVELVVGWTKVPDEPPLELLKSINADNQVLAYENGRYYNAWFEFEPSEGAWFWMDDADSEPNPSHYRDLPKGPDDLSRAALSAPTGVAE